jgi:hypothetical protein
MIFLSSYTMGSDTQNLLDAVAAAKNSGEEQILVLEDRKEYTITQTIDVSGLTILGNGSKLIFDFIQPEDPPTNHVGLIAEGSLGVPRDIETTAVKNTYFVHSPDIVTDNLETGDLILVSSDTIRGEGVKIGEIKRVYKYESDKVYFNDYLFDTYETAALDNGYVAKINPVALQIHDLEIEYIDPDSVSLDTTGIQVKYGENVVISNVKFNNAKAASIRLMSCYNPLVDNCEVNNSNLSGEGHGVLLANACMYATIRDSKFVGIRHAVIMGGDTNEPGIQWEASIHNVSGTITTLDSEKVFAVGGMVGSMKLTDCTAIGGWNIDEYTDWHDEEPEYKTDDIVSNPDEFGFYKLYKALVDNPEMGINPYANPSEWEMLDPDDFKYGGIEIKCKGDVVIQDFRAIALRYGVKVLGDEVEKLNLIVKDLYADEVAHPVYIGESGDNVELDLLTVDGLISTSYKDSYDHQYPAIMIQYSSINKWQFNNIKCYNKRLMVIDNIDVEINTIPEELVINNSTVTYSDALSGGAPSDYLLGLSETALDRYPVSTIVFNNLKTDGSKLFYVNDVSEMENTGLFFIFNSCTFTNIPASSFGFKNEISIKGLVFNNCEYEVNNSRFIELGALTGYIGLSGNTFLGTLGSSLVNNPSSNLSVLYHTGNYLNGNTLINNSPTTDKEYGDT